MGKMRGPDQATSHLNVYWIECVDPWKSSKMGDVERQNTCHRVHLHDGNQVSIVGLLSRDAMVDHDLLPSLEDVGSVGQKPNSLLRLASSVAALAAVKPSPLSSRGRVATAHDSISF